MKRFFSLLLALLLAVLPSLSLAATNTFSLSTLTDQELLELQKELEAELVARGLSLSSATSSGISSDTSQTFSSTDSLVWIPNSGSKYHSTGACSNMKNPKQVTLSEAKRLGYTPCSKCNPPK